MFVVSRTARKNKNPTLDNWANIERIFKYLSYTINYGIKFTKERSLKVYVDADYAGDTESRKSTSGFLMMIRNSPTSWYSKLQKCVATSTDESENYGVSECAKHSLWYMNILNKLNININFVTNNIDNMAAKYNC